MEFSRREYWNGLPLLHPGAFPNLEIKPASHANSLPLSHWGKYHFTVPLTISVPTLFDGSGGLPKATVPMKSGAQGLINHPRWLSVFKGHSQIYPSDMF